MKPLADLFGGGLALLPNHTQDGLLEFAEAGGIMVLSVWFRVRMGGSATAHSATDCNTMLKVSTRGEFFPTGDGTPRSESRESRTATPKTILT
jgi:hypothetical protein